MDDNKEEEKIDVQEETEKYIIRNMESSLERPKYSAKGIELNMMIDKKKTI